MQTLDARHDPPRGELAVIALFAVLLRVSVFASAMHIGHFSVSQYTRKGDTSSYIANAAAMCGERSRASLSEYDLRVFPGYPALIAITHRLGISLAMSALCITWISAGVAAAAAGRVFEDARIGWAMTCLIPHYLINSSLGMSEAPLLAVVCVALLVWKMDRVILAGVLFAVAGMIRPMACFAFAGVLLAIWRPAPVRWFTSTRLAAQLKYKCTTKARRREGTKEDPKNPISSPSLSSCLRTFVPSWRMFFSASLRDSRYAGQKRPLFLLLASTAVMFAVEAIAFQLWTGDALRGIHVYSQNPGAYGGHLLAWPFHSLLTTPGIDGASRGRILYIWIHVAVTLLACAMVTGQILPAAKADWRDLISFPWLIGNTAFVLCIGSVWGFRHFPRFTIPAAPAMFWTLRNILPRRVIWWVLIALGCSVMAVCGVIGSP